MRALFTLIFVLVVKNANCQIVYPEEEEYCRERIGNDANCVRITECPTAKDDIKQGKQPISCGFSGDVPLVCCLISGILTEPTITSGPFCGRNIRFRDNDGVLFRNDSKEENENDQSDRLEINTDGSYIIQPRILSREKFLISSEEWPWMVAIYLKSNGSFVCNGFLISNSHLLTAAHCFNGRRKQPRNYYVGLIHNEGKMEAEVTELNIHHDYSDKYYYYKDIALLKISKSAENAASICMPSGVNDSKYTLEKEILVLDWIGTEYVTEKNQIAEIQLCDRLYTNLSNSPFPNGVTDELLCATPTEASGNTCQIHSGGPVMIEENGSWKAIAIATFGIPCTLPTYPAVYTKISPYLQWIRSKE